ncbi:MAG TPA: hypothetical protein VF691_10575 [Cytophagaceae bacterium]|jgi:hypothetical protein
MRRYLRIIYKKTSVSLIAYALLAAPAIVSAQNTFPATGNVGIGTLTPDAKFHVHANSNVYTFISSATGQSNLELRSGGIAAQSMLTFAIPEKSIYRSVFIDVKGDFKINGGALFTSTRAGSFGLGTALPNNFVHLYSRDKEAVIRLQSAPFNGDFGSSGLEFWSDAMGSANEWRPAVIKSFDGGVYEGGLRFFTNGSGAGQRQNMKETMKMTNGKVVIGDEDNSLNISSSSYSLFVEKGILTERLKVAVGNSSNWADYVFDKNYKRLSLSEVERFVNKNKHLPGIPSGDEMVKNGMDVLEMNAKLLEKIEELTLHTIELNKKYEALEKTVNKGSK